MKKPVLLLFHHGEALSEFEAVLRRFGIEVQVCSRIDQVRALTERESPDLVVLYEKPVNPEIKKNPFSGGFEVATAHFQKRPDLFAVHEFLQKNLKNYSRNHPRMAVDLPCVFFRRGSSHIANILSFGTGGVFVKSGYSLIKKGDEIEVAVPLLGMKKELELRGEVAYRIAPHQENNYLHGFGVRFMPLDASTRETLREYLSYSLDESIGAGHEAELNFRQGLRSSPDGWNCGAYPSQISLRT